MVVINPASEHRSNLTGLLESLVRMGFKTSVRVLKMRGISASPEVADALQIKAGEDV